MVVITIILLEIKADTIISHVLYAYLPLGTVLFPIPYAQLYPRIQICMLKLLKGLLTQQEVNAFHLSILLVELLSFEGISTIKLNSVGKPPMKSTMRVSTYSVLQAA